MVLISSLPDSDGDALSRVRRVLRPNHPDSDWRIKGYARQDIDDVLPAFDRDLDKVVRVDGLSTFLGSDHESQLASFSDFEERAQPVVISGLTEAWPAMNKWHLQELIDCHGGHHVFKLGPNSDVETLHQCYVSLQDFRDYVFRGCDFDDSPLYLSDSLFAEDEPVGLPDLLKDYSVPPCFDDLMGLVGTGLERPPHRYIFIGSCRTGGPMHVDLMETHAWNTVVQGSKRWVMLPPCTPEPGCTECPAVEWFVSSYPKVRERHIQALDAGLSVSLSSGVSLPGIGLVEFIQSKGETVFTPRGWWHCVVNLDEDVTTAITHNYVSRTNLLEAYRHHLKEDPEMAARLHLGISAQRPELVHVLGDNQNAAII